MVLKTNWVRAVAPDLLVQRVRDHLIPVAIEHRKVGGHDLIRVIADAWPTQGASGKPFSFATDIVPFLVNGELLVVPTPAHPGHAQAQLYFDTAGGLLTAPVVDRVLASAIDPVLALPVLIYEHLNRIRQQSTWRLLTSPEQLQTAAALVAAQLDREAFVERQSEELVEEETAAVPGETSA